MWIKHKGCVNRRVTVILLDPLIGAAFVETQALFEHYLATGHQPFTLADAAGNVEALAVDKQKEVKQWSEDFEESQKVLKDLKPE